MCITFCTDDNDDDDDDDFLRKLCWHCSWGSEKLNVPYIRRRSVVFDINCSLCT